jgi:hypothetical protein
VARTKVVRTRLSPAEEAILQEDAESAGISPSEYLRRLVVERRELRTRVDNIEQRVIALEEYVSPRWSQEGQHAQDT